MFFSVITVNLNWEILNWEVLAVFSWDGIEDLILWVFKTFKRFKF